MVNKYSKISKSRLGEAHKDLQVVFKEVLKHFDHSIICGHRGEQEQDTAFESGFSKVKFPNSRHNLLPSMAVDAIPFPIDWKDTKRMIHFAGYVMATAKMFKEQGLITHNFRWGGDWDRDTELNDNVFQDYPHFELRKDK